MQCVEYEPTDRPPIKEVLEWLDELLSDPEFNLDGDEEDELVRPSEFMERFSLESASDSGRTLSTVPDDGTISSRSLVSSTTNLWAPRGGDAIYNIRASFSHAISHSLPRPPCAVDFCGLRRRAVHQHNRTLDQHHPN